MFVSSYFDEWGDPVGFGIAAHKAAADLLAVAHDIVGAWSSALRTRRLMVATVDPSCAGSQRAMETIERVVNETAGPVFVLGTTTLDIHGPVPPYGHGAAAIDDLSEIPDNATVIFPAHGVPLTVRTEAVARGINIIDATCPLVRSAQAKVQQRSESGDHVLLIGNKEHAAVPPLVGQAPNAVRLIETADDVDNLALDPELLSYVVEPGMVMEDAAKVVTSLRSRHPRIRGPHPRDFCYAASDRAATVRMVASACDVIFVLGSPGSADVENMATLASSCGAETHIVDDLVEIRREWLAKSATIGLVATSSASAVARDDLIDALSGLGPLSVVHRGVHTHVDESKWIADHIGQSTRFVVGDRSSELIMGAAR